MTLHEVIVCLADGGVHELPAEDDGVREAFYRGRAELVPAQDTDSARRRRAAGTCGIRIRRYGP